GLVVLALDRHRKRCDLALGYIVSPALDNAQRTVFLEDGCRLVGVLLELLAVGSRHRGYEPVDVGHDVSPVTSGCSVILAIYCPFKRFSRPIDQRSACVVSSAVPGCVNGTHDFSSAPVEVVRATPPKSVRQVFAEWYEMREFITLLGGAVAWPL